jgi:hypothetical protein
VVILALAAAQWEAGRLNLQIKNRALKIIEDGRLSVANLATKWQQHCPCNRNASTM